MSFAELGKLGDLGKLAEAAGEIGELGGKLEGEFSGIKIDSGELLKHLDQKYDFDLAKLEADFGIRIKDLDIKYDNAGKPRFEIGGKEVKFERVNELMKEGNFRAAYEEMGVDKKVLDSNEFRRFEARAEAEVYNSEPAKFEREMKEVKEVSENVEAELKTEIDVDMEGMTEQQVEARLDEAIKKDPRFKKAVENVDEKIKEKLTKDGEVEVGKTNKWKLTKKIAKGVLALGAAGFMGWLAVEHQRRSNGCWLVRRDGEKKRVKILTCPNISVDDYKDTMLRMPLKGCNKVCPEKYEGCEPKICFGNDTCVKYKEVDDDGNELEEAECEERLKRECPQGGSCTKYCSTNYLSVPDGATLTCVSMNFWQSLVDVSEDIVKKPFEYAEKAGKSAFNFLKKFLYVALGILGLLILIRVVFAISKKLMEKKPNSK